MKRNIEIWLGIMAGLFAGNVAIGQTILNPSFESEHDDIMPTGNSTDYSVLIGMPDDWSWRWEGYMNGLGAQTTPAIPSSWSSDGDWSLYVFAAVPGSIFGTHHVGDYVEFYQEVDFTEIEELAFDVKLEGGTYTESYLAIDGQALWTDNVAGTHYGVTVDASDYVGVHELQLGVRVFAAFGFEADGWTRFDNLTPEPSSLLLLIGGLPLLRRRRIS